MFCWTNVFFEVFNFIRILRLSNKTNLLGTAYLSMNVVSLSKGTFWSNMVLAMSGSIFPS